VGENCQVRERHSGANYWTRPALAQLRQEVKTDLFDAIYFLWVDRTAREVAHQTIIVDEIKHGKRIIIDGKDYVRNPEDRLTLTMPHAWRRSCISLADAM
jgi:DNA invertase Pin-like site-specific DNA recombinase